MELVFIQEKLLDVIRTIRTWGGHGDAETIVGETCPLDLDKFDSKLEPTAIDMLSDLLEIPIANDINIFRTGDKRKKLRIHEIAVNVRKILPSGSK